MTHANTRPESTTMDEIKAVYQSLERDVRSHEEAGDPFGDIIGDESTPIADALSHPIDLWERGAKPTRTAPALVAYKQRFDRNPSDTLMRVLVGLDVLVTMLDETIDTADTGPRHRLDLAINATFASLMSFASVPAGERGRALDAVTDFLVRTARIPLIERRMRRRAERVDDPDRAIRLARITYAARARDISAFGRLPAIIDGVDERATRRLTDDIETYRAHYLLFDDLRDVREDRRHGTETPVSWVLADASATEVALDRLAKVFSAFTYSNAPYRTVLREMERQPTELETTVRSAMSVIEDESYAGVERQHR